MTGTQIPPSGQPVDPSYQEQIDDLNQELVDLGITIPVYTDAEWETVDPLVDGHWVRHLGRKATYYYEITTQVWSWYSGARTAADTNTPAPTNPGAVRYFATLGAAAAAGDFEDGQVIQTAGRMTSEDGGDAIYVYKSTGRAAAFGTNAEWWTGGLVVDGIGVDDWIDTDKTVINARQCGLKFDGSDEGTAAQAFLDMCDAYTFDRAEVIGGENPLGTSIGLTIVGSATNAFNFECIIQAVGTTGIDTLLTIGTISSGADWAEMSGRLRVFGEGGTADYASRNTRDGLLILNSSRVRFDRLEAQYFARYGITVSGIGSDNSTMCDLGEIAVDRCGGGNAGDTYAHETTWSNAVNSGSSNSGSQRTTVDVVAQPSEDTRYCSIDGELFLITNQGAGTVELYPWLDSTATPGTISYYDGAGVLITGNDAARVRIQGLDAVRCSQVLASEALIGPSVDRLLAQSCAIGISLTRGAATNGTVTGGQYNGCYFENLDFEMVKVPANTVTKVTVVSPSPLDFSKVVALAVKNDSDVKSASATVFRGVTFIEDAYRRTGKNYGGFLSPSIVELVPGDKRINTFGNAQVFNLNHDADLDRLFGDTWVEVFCTGTGVNNEPDTSITFNPGTGAGVTVNGVGSFVHTPTGATLYTCQMRGTNWEVFAQVIPLAT